MPYVRNIHGIVHNVSEIRAREMVEEDGAVIIPDPTIKDHREVNPKSNEGEANIVKLRAEFEGKFKEPVPNNKKNDAAWIQERREFSK
jgi:hypothetical protein